ncbi:MAG: thiol reductase thioredoxin [Bacteroidales bacterium]|nr:thiol reductase thioredoxin [Bacteroidales bacterium]
MKKLLIAFVLTGFIIAGCNSQQSSDQNQNVTGTTEKVIESKPVMLTKQKFLDEIMDYEQNPKEWLYKGELPGLVDFYADWCRPCRITSPILEELAQEYAGKIKVYKIDVQAEQELAAVFGIQSIPSFLFIPKDNTPVMSSGIAQTPEQTKQMFRQQIEEILLSNN